MSYKNNNEDNFSKGPSQDEIYSRKRTHCVYCRGTFVIVAKDKVGYEYAFRCHRCDSSHLSANYVKWNDQPGYKII